MHFAENKMYIVLLIKLSNETKNIIICWLAELSEANYIFMQM